MNTAPAPLPLAEVTRRAIRVLARELGPADAARFVGQFTTGSGDYTTDRDHLFDGLTLDELTAAVRKEVTGSPPAADQSR